MFDEDNCLEISWPTTLKVNFMQISSFLSTIFAKPAATRQSGSTLANHNFITISHNEIGMIDSSQKNKPDVCQSTKEYTNFLLRDVQDETDAKRQLLRDAIGSDYTLLKNGETFSVRGELSKQELMNAFLDLATPKQIAHLGELATQRVFINTLEKFDIPQIGSGKQHIEIDIIPGRGIVATSSYHIELENREEYFQLNIDVPKKVNMEAKFIIPYENDEETVCQHYKIDAEIIPNTSEAN